MKTINIFSYTLSTLALSSSSPMKEVSSEVKEVTESVSLAAWWELSDVEGEGSGSITVRGVWGLKEI